VRKFAAAPLTRGEIRAGSSRGETAAVREQHAVPFSSSIPRADAEMGAPSRTRRRSVFPGGLAIRYASHIRPFRAYATTSHASKRHPAVIVPSIAGSRVLLDALDYGLDHTLTARLNRVGWSTKSGLMSRLSRSRNRS